MFNINSISSQINGGAQQFRVPILLIRELCPNTCEISFSNEGMNSLDILNITDYLFTTFLSVRV